MNRRFYAVLAVFATLAACNPQLHFTQDQDGVWTVPERQMDRWAAAIIKADDTGAKALLDQGYGMADSLTAGDPDARTLESFAAAVAGRFMDLESPYYSDHACEMALDREALCVNWTSWGRRRTDWKRSILNLNRPGTRVSDFWLSKGTGQPDTLLRKLLPGAPLTVLFIYGEGCSSCERMIEDIGKSRVFPKLQEEGRTRFVSIYTGEDGEEFKALGARLPAFFDNWRDRGNVVLYSRAFDTRMIPSLYVIDKDEIVLLRGGKKIPDIESFLLLRE